MLILQKAAKPSQPNTSCVLGVTGNSGTGKTTLAAYLRQHGASVIDADVAARAVVAANSPGLKKLQQAFGAKILTAAGELNRKSLSDLVFANADKLATLNAILAPLIKTEIIRLLAAAKKQYASLIVLDIPLLFEQGYEQYCDFVLVCVTAKTEKINRLQVRDGLSLAQAQKRLAAQMSDEQQKKLADGVIDTTGSLQNTIAQLQRFLHEWGVAIVR